MTLKYRFIVTYQTKKMKQVSDFMNNCDIPGSYCKEEIFEFNYTKDEKPISYFKDLFRQAFESIECNVLHIEGGKIE